MKIVQVLSVIIVMLMAFKSKGNIVNQEINCHTPRKAKTFIIKRNKVVLQDRGLASINAIRVKRIGKGFTHFFKHEGLKHKLHISNTESFSEFNDYISIRSAQGHEITYPLTCK